MVIDWTDTTGSYCIPTVSCRVPMEAHCVPMDSYCVPMEDGEGDAWGDKGGEIESGI